MTFNRLLTSFDVLNSKKWAAEVTSPLVGGEQQVQCICNYFDLVYDDFEDDFRDYVDQPDHTPKTIALLVLRRVLKKVWMANFFN